MEKVQKFIDFKKQLTDPEEMEQKELSGGRRLHEAHLVGTKNE